MAHLLTQAGGYPLTKMHPATNDDKTSAERPSQQGGAVAMNPAVHPFVNAFANIGAMMGRDLGVVALRSIENQRGNTGAVCLWQKEHAPKVILDKLPPDMLEKLFAVMLVPVGVKVPGFNFTDVEVQAATVTIIDGSQLVAFILP